MFLNNLWLPGLIFSAVTKAAPGCLLYRGWRFTTHVTHIQGLYWLIIYTNRRTSPGWLYFLCRGSSFLVFMATKTIRYDKPLEGSLWSLTKVLPEIYARVLKTAQVGITSLFVCVCVCVVTTPWFWGSDVADRQELMVNFPILNLRSCSKHPESSKSQGW